MENAKWKSKTDKNHELIQQLFDLIINDEKDQLLKHLEKNSNLLNHCIFYCIIFGKDKWVIQLLKKIDANEIYKFTSLGLNLTLVEALIVNDSIPIKKAFSKANIMCQIELDLPINNKIRNNVMAKYNIPTLEKYQFMPKNKLEHINMLEERVGEIKYQKHIGIHQLKSPCCLKSVKPGMNLREFKAMPCDVNCENINGCKRTVKSLKFLKDLSLQEDFVKGEFLLFGSVPKHTKVDRYNECDVQIRFTKDASLLTDKREQFMDKLQLYVNNKGNKYQVYTTKSGACIIETRRRCINSYDIIPMTHAGYVDLCAQMRNQLIKIRKCELEGWREIYNKILCNSIIFYENPEHANKLCASYKVNKLTNLNGKCFKTELYVPSKICDELNKEQRQVITSVKILAQKLGLNDVKSYSIETITRLVKLTGKISRDMFTIMKFPTLKWHFKDKINYTKWELWMKNVGYDNLGDNFTIPLLSK